MTDEIDAVGNIEEAVHVPTAIRTLRQRNVPRARHAETRSGRDAQQVEIRVAPRQLALQLVEIQAETLDRVSGVARGRFNVREDGGDGDGFGKSRHRPRARHDELQRRAERFGFSAERSPRRANDAEKILEARNALDRGADGEPVGDPHIIGGRQERTGRRKVGGAAGIGGLAGVDKQYAGARNRAGERIPRPQGGQDTDC
jgi:hypothetical protein